MRSRLPAVALLLSAAVATGQEPVTAPPPPPQVFSEKVEVRVLDLDVDVTDSKGQPVTGLTRDDFTVEIAGRPARIDYFTRVDAGTIHTPDLAAASPDQVLKAYRQGDETIVPRNFLIYIDLGFISPGIRNRSLNALSDFVSRLGPHDATRVVLFDRSPTVLTDWTTSKETAMAAISKIESEHPGMSRLQTQRQTIAMIDSTPRRRRGAYVQQYAAETAQEIETMLDEHAERARHADAAVGQEVVSLRVRRLRVPARIRHVPVRVGLHRGSVAQLRRRPAGPRASRRDGSQRQHRRRHVLHGGRHGPDDRRRRRRQRRPPLEPPGRRLPGAPGPPERPSAARLRDGRTGAPEHQRLSEGTRVGVRGRLDLLLDRRQPLGDVARQVRKGRRVGQPARRDRPRPARVRGAARGSRGVPEGARDAPDGPHLRRDSGADPDGARRPPARRSSTTSRSPSRCRPRR